MLKRTINLILVLILLATTFSIAYANQPAKLDGKKDTPGGAPGKGFDEWGYNRKARIFNGTGWSWCMGKVGNEEWCTDYLGTSANDKLKMKWNAEWDRGNSEGWSKPPYEAWEDNLWNGRVPGGSGGVWHYKIVWVGECGADYTELPNGGYCLWGQFEVIMDQGTSDGEHLWYNHAKSTGYGSYP